MIERIEALKTELNKQIEISGDWKTPYYSLIKELYKLDVVFVALSKKFYNAETHTSEPLISTKDFDGEPAMYVFSDIDIATTWMKSYGFFTEDFKYSYIGAVRKADFDFLAMYKIAANFGTTMIMLDEGGSYVGIRMNDFLSGNGIDPRQIDVPISRQQMENAMESGTTPQLQFVPVPAIKLAR